MIDRSGILIGFVVALLVTIIGDMVSEEVRTRLDRLPHLVIKLAGRRLNDDIRTQFISDWTAELGGIIRQHRASGLPITRFVIGLRFGWGLLRTAKQTNAALSRPDEQQDAQNDWSSGDYWEAVGPFLGTRH